MNNVDLQKNFSVKIKDLRLRDNITQKKLAELLHYSEKAVAKWESGKSLPSIETLYKIALLFNVTVDYLLTTQNDVYFLGIDGGGTETKYAISDKDGNVFKRYVGIGCNPIDLGWEKSLAILTEGIKTICSGIPYRNIVLFAGLAGWHSYSNKKYLMNGLEMLGFNKVAFGSDVDNAISIGLNDEDGLVVIMGTGISIIRRIGGENEYVSGWGYLIDDGGSGYNIGRDGLCAYFAEYDGTGEHTSITEYVVEKAKLEGRALCSEIYAGGKRYVASFAKSVFASAMEGDKIANDIIDKNVEIASTLIVKAVKPLSKDVNIVFTGGVIEQEFFREKVFKRLQKEGLSNLSMVNAPLVDGALKRARKLLNGEKND